MKLFNEFIIEASETQNKLIDRSVELIKQHKNNPDKFNTYLNLLRKTRQRAAEPDVNDEENRKLDRKDKHRQPMWRLPPEERKDNPSTVTKDPKKLRKQKAIGEIE